MKEEQWFKDLCFVDLDKVNEKEVKKTLKSKALEVIGQLKKVYKSSNSLPIFNIHSDNFKKCQDAFVMTLFLMVDTKKTKESKNEVIIERIKNGYFDSNDINTAYASLSIIFEEKMDGKKMSFLDIIQNEKNMYNYNPWSIKIRDPKTQLENFPSTPDIFKAPPVGVTSRSYGYYISNHASDGTLANDLSYIFNIKIAIDDLGYPVQAILKKAVHKKIFDKFIDDNVIFSNIYASLTKRDNAFGFPDIKRTHVSGDICLLIDEIGQEEIEITPMMSIQFYENRQQAYSKIRMNGNIIGGLKKASIVTVGGGQPQNVGRFALNTSGVILHDTQSDIPYIGKENLKGRIQKISHRNILSNQIKYLKKIKNIYESDYNYEKRKREGILKAIKTYTKFIEKLRTDINKLFENQLQDDISQKVKISTFKNNFIDHISRNDKQTYDFINNVLLNQKDNELAINVLAKHIYMEIYMGLYEDYISKNEYNKDIEFIIKHLWNIYIPYSMPKYAY